MEAEGVTFGTGVTVGADVTAERAAEREFDAVVLATGRDRRARPRRCPAGSWAASTSR